jgi:hypothetical protein
MIRRLKMKHIMKIKASGQGPAKTNPVAKHAGKFNRSAVFQNRKKASQNGHTRFQVDYTDLVDSDGSNRTDCKRENSKPAYVVSV